MQLRKRREHSLVDDHESERIQVILREALAALETSQVRPR